MADVLTDEQMAGAAPPHVLTDEEMAGAPRARHAAPAIPDPTVGGAVRDLSANDVAEGIAGVGNSMADRATFGLHNVIQRIFGDPFGAVAGVDKYRSEHPTISAITDAPAYLNPSTPVNAVARGVEARLPDVTNRAAQIAKTALTSAGVSGLQGGTEALSHGESFPEAGEQALESAGTGLVAGAAMAAPASALGALGEAVANSRGGLARQKIEQRGQGAKVGPFTPGKGGVYDRELGGMDWKKGSKTEGFAASRGAKGLMSTHEQAWSEATDYPIEEYRTPVSSYSREARAREAEARGPKPDRKSMYVGRSLPEAENRLGQIESERALDRKTFGALKAGVDDKAASFPLRDVTHLRTQVEEAIYDAETPEASVPKLERALKSMERHTDNEGRVMMPERQLNALRRRAFAGTSIGRGEDTRPGGEAVQREVAGDLKGEVDQGPYADVNKFYTKASGEHQARRQGEGLGKKEPKNRQTDVNRIASRMGSQKYIDDLASFDKRRSHAADERAAYVDDFASSKTRAAKERGQLGLDEDIPKRRQVDIGKVKRALLNREKDTHTAGDQDAPDIGDFVLAHPRAGVFRDLPDLAAERNKLSFGLKSHGSDLLEAARLASSHGKLRLLLRNLPGIQGRLLYPGAREAELAEPELLKLIPLLNAARRAQGASE